MQNRSNLRDKRLGRLRQPVDGASLAVLRLGVGGVAAISIVRLWATGWLETLIVAPTHHLRYPGFDWIPIPSPGGIKLLAALAFLAAVSFSVGSFTRLSGAVFVATFGWFELVEATTYLNHYWLMGSLVLVLTILPSGSTWSLDARRNASLPSPSWLALYAVRAQIVIVYLFAGIAKLHHDWLINALPLRIWLPSRSDMPVFGSLLEEPAIALVASWAGAMFDLSIGALLLWPRTRRPAYVALVGFHVATVILLPSIGLFPVLMTIAATIFFAPGWPRRVLANVLSREWRTAPTVTRPVGPAKLGTLLIVGWLTLQVLLPLRHLTFPGDARWSGEGYRLAWNVVAVERHGSLAFWVETESGIQLVDPGEWFTDFQLRVAAAEPDLILQVAQVVGSSVGEGRHVAVYAEAWLSINGRPPQRLIDPDIDLMTAVASPRRTVLSPSTRLGW